MSHQRLIPLVVALLALGGSVVAPAQDASPTIELVLETGTPLRVILPERVRMRDVGQPLAGSLLEDVYSYDRVVLPAGTRVLGRVARFESVRGRQRAGAMLGGDFTPLRRAILEFDSLVLDDGCQIEVRTEVRSTTEHLVLSTREAPKKNVAEEAAAQVAATARKTVAEVKKPRKGDRLKHGLVMALPYHPQYLEGGTVFTAILLAPLDFGSVEPAAPGTRPAPGSVLRARLLAPLDSSKTTRGAPVQAMVTPLGIGRPTVTGRGPAFRGKMEERHGKWTSNPIDDIEHLAGGGARRGVGVGADED